MARKKLTRQKSLSIDHSLALEFQNNLKIRLSGWKKKIELTEPMVTNVPNELFDITADQIIFPIHLSSAHRRFVHLIAMELELFHCSIGSSSSSSSSDQRQIIVSRQLPILTPFEENLTPAVSFKSNILHQYFELTEEDRLHRQALLGIGFDHQRTEELQNQLSSSRKQNLQKILFPLSDSSASVSVSSSSRASPPDDLSDTIGVDPNPFRPRSSFISVTTLAHLQEISSLLSRAVNHEIGFDLEMSHSYVFHGCTCLIQISCRTMERYVCGIDLSLEQPFLHDGGSESEAESVRTTATTPTTGASPSPFESESYDLDIFIDPMYLQWKDIAKELFPIFSDPSIVKVCHGARNGDVKALYRDFGIVIVNGFDTQEAWRCLGEVQLGLANVLMKLHAPGSGWEKALVRKGDQDASVGLDGGEEEEEEGVEDYHSIKQRLSQADWTQRFVSSLPFSLPLSLLCASDPSSSPPLQTATQ
jgi:hypothetical protein